MISQFEAVLDWMLSKAPEETWGKEMGRCVSGLRKEAKFHSGSLPHWLGTCSSLSLSASSFVT